MPDDQQSLWSKIVEQHGERVFRIAFRILGSIHDAEDVAQDAFTEAYQLHQDGPVQNWPGLLVRLATFRAIDRLRRIRPVVELQGDQQVSTVEPFELAAATELNNWLRSAMAQLPNQQAAVFAMICLEQLSRQEVSENLDISPKAVSTALYKARQRLSELLIVFNQGDE